MAVRFDKFRISPELSINRGPCWWPRTTFDAAFIGRVPGAP